MTAFKATFSDMKLIKTREVTQLIFEIPTQEFDAAYEVLGGVPISGKERWFAIAAINLSPAAKEISPATPQPSSPRSAGVKRDWRDMQPAQQAGIRCAEPIFAAFLRERHALEWHEAPNAADCVRLICAVHSRVELGTNQKARVIWHQLDESFQAWKALEHA